jgi:hypothetical protein
MAWSSAGFWKKEDFFLKHSLPKILELMYITVRISQMITLILNGLLRDWKVCFFRRNIAAA